MDNIERSTAYLGTLEINQQNIRHKNNDSPDVLPKNKSSNRTLSVNANGMVKFFTLTIKIPF